MLDRSQSLIDQRKYTDAIQYIETELPSHPSQELTTKLAFAYLGRSGIELFQIAEKLNIVKSFKDSLDLSNASEKICGTSAHQYLYSPILCLPVIKFDFFPSSDQPDFKKAMDLLYEINPDPATSQEDMNLMIAVLELARIVKNYDELIFRCASSFNDGDHWQTREEQIAQTSEMLRYVKNSLGSLDHAISRLYYSYGKIRRFLDRFKDKPILSVGGRSYYATDHLSGEDFLRFVVNAGKSELGDQSEGTSDEINALGGVLDSIRNTLYHLHIQFEVHQQNLQSLTDHFFDAASGWMPRSVHVNSNQHYAWLNIGEGSLPIAVRNTAKSIRDAWESGDTRSVFDQAQALYDQLQRLQELDSNWQYFWSSLSNDDQQMWLNRVESLRDGVPFFEVSVTERPDLKKLVAWYQSIGSGLDDLSKQACAEYPNRYPFNILPVLVDDTKTWVHANLY